MLSLPSEILLDVFDRLTPTDAFEPTKIDLRNVRLTCKLFSSIASELLFKHYDLFLRLDQDRNFAEPISYRLLRECPKYGKLVRSVRISVACANIHDFRWRLVPALPTHAQKGGYILCKARRTLGESGKHLEARLVPAIKEFYREYLSTHWFFYRYPQAQELSNEIRRRLSLFPNLRHVSLSRATFQQLPQYKHIVEFWKARGLPQSLSRLFTTDLFGHTTTFPWHIQTLVAGLRHIPPCVTTMSLHIKPSQPTISLLDVDHGLFTQLDSLDLVMDTTLDGIAASRATAQATLWTWYIQRFETLTTISLRNHAYDWFCPLHAVGDPSTRGYCSIFLKQMHLPKLRHLSLAGWGVHATSLMNLHSTFPILRYLSLEKIVILSSGSTNEYLKWYEIAETMGERFDGKCRLEFGSGPFVEIEGPFDDSIMFQEVHWVPGIRAHTLKTRALDIIAAVSQQRVRKHQLYERWTRLISHTPPDYVHAVAMAVETPGMTHMYWPDQHPYLG